MVWEDSSWAQLRREQAKLTVDATSDWDNNTAAKPGSGCEIRYPRSVSENGGGGVDGDAVR